MNLSRQMWHRALMERQAFQELYDTWPCEFQPAVTWEHWIPFGPEESTRIIFTRPEGTAGKILPGFLSLHGGGYIRGNADYDQRFCHRTANETGCLCINVQYKLAPEYHFPHPVEECYNALQWVLAHGEELGLDCAHLAIGGHSAGGNLTAVLCQLARDRKGTMPCCQIMDYAPFTLAGPAPFDGFGPELELPLQQRAAYFNASYLTDLVQEHDPMASPLEAVNFSELPPALIITAGKDPLCAGGQEYAKRLSQAGCQVDYHCFSRCAHGFTVMPGLGPAEDVEAAWNLIHQFLKSHF